MSETRKAGSVRRWLVNLLRRFEDKSILWSGINQSTGPWRIYDGIFDFLPVPVPSSVRDKGQTQAYLREASDIFHQQFGKPYEKGVPFQMLTTDPLAEWDQATRRYVLETCHTVWERDPLARRGVLYNRMFSVQNGMEISYRNEMVKEAIEEFTNEPENAFREQEKTFIDALQVDGELFIRFYGATEEGGAPGEILIAPMLPWGVQAINADPEFFRRIESYQYTVSQTMVGTGTTKAENKPIPASDVLHVAVNRLPYEQRGRPELVSILPWLRAYREWLQNRARHNYYRGAILWDVTLTGATASQVATKRAQYKEPPGPASLAIHNEKEVWAQTSAPVGASDAAEDGRQMKMQIAAGLGIPEYMLSDGSNANLASATAQQLPAIRGFEEWQDISKDQIWGPIFKRVIQAKIDADLIPEEVDEQDSEGNPVFEQNKDGQLTTAIKKIKAVDAFEIKYAPLGSSDPKNIMEALQLAIANELMSDETAVSLAPWDLDYAVEQKRLSAQRKRVMDEMAQGLRPMPVFGQNGQPNGQEPGQSNGQDQEDEQPPEEKPKKQRSK